MSLAPGRRAAERCGAPVAALRHDGYLAVALVAVHAFPRLYRSPAQGASSPVELATSLLIFQAYASDTVRRDTVTDALDNAISLSVGHPWEDQAWQASLAIIQGMRAYDADRSLTRICPWDCRPLLD